MKVLEPVKDLQIGSAKLSLNTCEMHVAPGGSTVLSILGKGSDIAGFLFAAREEIPLGICGVDVQSDGIIQMDIYMGKADVASFLVMLMKDTAGKTWKYERREIEEGTLEMSYTLASREHILSALLDI